MIFRGMNEDCSTLRTFQAVVSSFIDGKDWSQYLTWVNRSSSVDISVGRHSIYTADLAKTTRREKRIRQHAV